MVGGWSAGRFKFPRLPILQIGLIRKCRSDHVVGSIEELKSNLDVAEVPSTVVLDCSSYRGSKIVDNGSLPYHVQTRQCRISTSV